MPRAKYPHCSARARDGLISLPPLHSLTHLLHRFRRSLSLIPKSSKLTRPSMQPAGAPKKGGPCCKHLVAALLARLEPSLRFRFSLIALGRGDKKNKMAARLRPARKQLRREALPIAEARGNSTARLRPVQGISNSRGDGPAFGRFAGCAPETGRPRWKSQISPRPRRWTSRPAVSGSPMKPWNWPSCRSVPAAGTQRNWHCAGATVPGGRDAVTDPAKF